MIFTGMAAVMTALGDPHQDPTLPSPPPTPPRLLALVPPVVNSSGGDYPLGQVSSTPTCTCGRRHHAAVVVALAPLRASSAVLRASCTQFHRGLRWSDLVVAPPRTANAQVRHLARGLGFARVLCFSCCVVRRLFEILSLFRFPN